MLQVARLGLGEWTAIRFTGPPHRPKEAEARRRTAPTMTKLSSVAIMPTTRASSSMLVWRADRDASSSAATSHPAPTTSFRLSTRSGAGGVVGPDLFRSLLNKAAAYLSTKPSSGSGRRRQPPHGRSFTKPLADDDDHPLNHNNDAAGATSYEGKPVVDPFNFLLVFACIPSRCACMHARLH